MLVLVAVVAVMMLVLTGMAVVAVMVLVLIRMPVITMMMLMLTRMAVIAVMMLMLIRVLFSRQGARRAQAEHKGQHCNAEDFASGARHFIHSCGSK